MGPPSKPVDKDRPTDMNELSDVLMGSGVDLKEEEAALLNRHNQDGHFLTNGAHSFDSRASGALINPGYNSHNVYSQNLPRGRDTFYGAGSFNQPAVSYQSAEERAEADRKAAVRKKAEMAQYHLNEPFLRGMKVHNIMMTKARGCNITIPMEGLYHSQGQQQQQGQRLYVCGPDKHDRLVTLKGEDLLNHDAPMVDLISLLSLAAEERIRTLIEDAAALAKERKTGTHGIVPLELSDLAAVHVPSSETVNGLPTPGNSAVSPKASPLKRSYSETNKLPTPISNGTQTPPPAPKPFPLNPVTSTLRTSYLAERKAEEDRLAKRARRAKSDHPDDPTSASGSAGGSGAATPGSAAPDISSIDLKKMPTKKELKRQAESRVSDAAQARATNQSLGMALGGAKKSWMTGGTATVHSNPMLPKVNTNAGAAGASSQPSSKASLVNGGGGGGGGGGSAVAGGGLPRMRVFDLREDGAKGVGIQLRDLVAVMERERRERRALAKSYLKIAREG
ncbi:MAG: hypothetical protein Q9182_001618 [Xanthomendoza sp. 2 TL-2023]